MRPAATLNAPMMMMREGAACHGMFAIFLIYCLQQWGCLKFACSEGGMWYVGVLAAFARFDSQELVLGYFSTRVTRNLAS